MVSVMLEGVHVVPRRLSGGRLVEYHYAWRGRGAPRLHGSPGSPEYIASYQEAYAGRKRPVTGTMLELIAGYKASADFTRLSDDTKRAYRRHLDQIQDKWGNLPIKALDDPKVRRHFLAWRDEFADRPRTADMAVGTLKRLLSWSVERVYIATNQAEPIKRLHHANRSDEIWSPDEMAALVAECSEELRWVVALAAHTALRQGDLIRLPWSAFDGTSFTIMTRKRKRRVLIPATLSCRAVMGAIKRRSPIILTTQRGKRPWTSDGVRASFNAACDRAKVTKTFHDLRRTAATNLLINGVDSPKVAMIMGWSEAEVDNLKRLYVSRAAVVAEVLAKLEGGG